MSPRNPGSARREAALWILESSRPNLSVSEQMRELFALVEGKDSALATLLSEQCQYDFFCGFTPSEDERMLILDADLLRRFALFPIDIVVDFLGETE